MYNPLRGLNMVRIAALLEIAERGYYSELVWLYRFMEKREPLIASIKARRAGAILKLQRKVVVKPSYMEEGEGGKSDPMPEAEKQRAYLQGCYDRIENMHEALDFLALAQFRGYSHLEKHYDAEGWVTRLQPVPHWYWVRKMPSPTWWYNPTATQSTEPTTEIDPENFIIREVDDPIDEPVLVYFLRKNTGEKDWDFFNGVFGMGQFLLIPPVSGQGAGDTAAASDVIASVSRSGRGVTPPGYTVASLTVAHEGALFEQRVRYCDEMICQRATGGKLTALSAPTGMNDSTADVHDGVFDELGVTEGMDISQVLQEQFDKVELALEFPDQPVMVEFQLVAKDQEDTAAFTDQTAKLSAAGYKTDPADVEEHLGVTIIESTSLADPNADPNAAPGAVEDDGAMGNRAKHTIKKPCQSISNRAAHDTRLLDEGTQRFAAAMRAKLQPIAGEVLAALSLPTEQERKARMLDIRGKLSERYREMAKDRTTDKALSDTIAASFVNGVVGAN